MLYNKTTLHLTLGDYAIHGKMSWITFISVLWKTPSHFHNQTAALVQIYGNIKLTSHVTSMLSYLCYAFVITFCMISSSKPELSVWVVQPKLGKSDCSWYKQWIATQLSVANLIRSPVTNLQISLTSKDMYTFCVLIFFITPYLTCIRQCLNN